MLESELAATLEHVEVKFPGGARALDGVDLRLARGVITAVVGESGSGKTTLCRVLAGLLPPTAGRALIDGSPIPRPGLGRNATARRHFHRTVQMLLQDAPGSLSPRMTVRRLLQEPISIHKLDRAAAAPRLESLLHRLGLGAALLDRYPHQLSGGQARRIAIARALLLQPTLLIADEPTAGLDLSVQGELLNLLLALKDDLGLTLLVSSHDLGVVHRIAHTTIVMYLGQIVEAGPTAALFARPAHPYTAALLSAHPTTDPAHRRTRIVLQGDLPSVYSPPEGCRFNTRCPKVQTNCRIAVPTLQNVAARSFRCHYPDTETQS